MKQLIILLSLLLLQVIHADVIVGNGNIKKLNSGVIKDINCQNYSIKVGGLLDTTTGGILREVTHLEINGTWNYGTGQVKELGAWVNNGTVTSAPTQTGATPNLQFTTLCGSISILGTSDTDGDGISDADEGNNAMALGFGITLDQDGDGIYNFLDLDSDGDGLSDAYEGSNDVDTDEDGVPDYLDNLHNISAITLNKIGTFIDENGNGYAEVGETIAYQFTVKNTGNTTLTDLNITDLNAEFSGSTSISILLASESNTVAFSAVHTLTLEDIIDEKVSNQAQIKATDSLDNIITALSDDPTNPVSSNDITITHLTFQPPLVADINTSSLTGNNADINILEHTTSGFFNLNPSSIKIIDPQTGNGVTELIVQGEGRWIVNTQEGVIRFIPESGYIGDPTTIEYSIEDTQGTQVIATLSVDYPPVAFDDTIEYRLSSSIVLHILDNDTHTSQLFDLMSIVLTDTHGTPIGTNNLGKELIVHDEGVWTVHDDGTLHFEPTDELVGNPTPIYYRLQDVKGDFTNVAKVTLTYIDSSPTPTATPMPTPTTLPTKPECTLQVNNDSDIQINTYKGTIIKVLENDSCIKTCGTLSFTQGIHGQVHSDNAGTDNNIQDDILIYTPEANLYNTTDNFQYTVTDCMGNSSTATVTLDINCASTQTSDGTSLGEVSLLLISILTLMIGLYFTRRRLE